MQSGEQLRDRSLTQVLGLGLRVAAAGTEAQLVTNTQLITGSACAAMSRARNSSASSSSAFWSSGASRLSIRCPRICFFPFHSEGLSRRATLFHLSQ
jgi:hypothetical protein